MIVKCDLIHLSCDESDKNGNQHNRTSWQGPPSLLLYYLKAAAWIHDLELLLLFLICIPNITPKNKSNPASAKPIVDPRWVSLPCMFTYHEQPLVCEVHVFSKNCKMWSGMDNSHREAQVYLKNYLLVFKIQLSLPLWSPIINNHLFVR